MNEKEDVVADSVERKRMRAVLGYLAVIGIPALLAFFIHLYFEDASFRIVAGSFLILMSISLAILVGVKFPERPLGVLFLLAVVVWAVFILDSWVRFGRAPTGNRGIAAIVLGTGMVYLFLLPFTAIASVVARPNNSLKADGSDGPKH